MDLLFQQKLIFQDREIIRQFIDKFKQYKIHIEILLLDYQEPIRPKMIFSLFNCKFCYYYI